MSEFTMRSVMRSVHREARARSAEASGGDPGRAGHREATTRIPPLPCRQLPVDVPVFSWDL